MDRSIRPLVTGAVMGGVFIAALDTTIVAAAMPDISRELGGKGLYAWPFAVYMVASTATVPLYGRLADAAGRKGLYLVAIGLFLLGSLLCGVAPTMTLLVAARLVQGLGAGGILPLALTVAGDLYEDHETRGRIMSLFSSVWALAAILGPLVGGGIVDHIGWRWIFLLNVPFGLISAAMLYRFHVDVLPAGSPARPDFVGACVFTLALGGFLTALLGVGESSWVIAGVAAAVALALVATFVRLETRAESPLVDTGLLRLRIVAASNAVGFLAGAMLFAAAVYVPLWVRDVERGSATDAGFALTPMSLGWFAGAFVVGRVLSRVGYKAPTVLGLALLTGAAVSLSLFRHGMPTPRIFATMALAGLGLGLAYTATLVAVQNAVGRDRLGQATSSVAFFRSVGGVFGVSVAGCIHLTSLRHAGTTPAAADPETLARSLAIVFVMCVIAGAGALVAGLFLPGGRRIVAAADVPVAAEDGETVWPWPDGKTLPTDDAGD